MKNSFQLKAAFSPAGDQEQAIKKLVQGVKKNWRHQVLLGVTGSGKTFTAAKVIEALQKPALVISHNKTLAAQLYQEFRDFFPQNAVSYFVSYYDYYQPEAYLPASDTYIAKETDINDLIDQLRLAATANIVSRRDVIVVASVSCLYGLGAPEEFFHQSLSFFVGDAWSEREIWQRLVAIGYERNDFDFRRGVFRVRGEKTDIFFSHQDQAVRLVIQGGKISKIIIFDPLTGNEETALSSVVIYPARHYLSGRNNKDIFARIRRDMKNRERFFKKQGKLIEAQRIRERVTYDLEMIAETGYVNGIENYSRYFDGRRPGDPPYTLIDYFSYAYQKDWLLFIDESHITLPQIYGMYRGDYARKKTLVDFGFRLPAAFDNRPLRYEEFFSRQPATIYMSATPGERELSLARKEGQVVEQLIRPTGLLDPQVVIRSTQGQVDDLIKEIKKKVTQKQRVLVLTVTKRLAEDLADFLKKANIRVTYIHSDIDTLDRSDILANLRKGKFDVLVGINLLREGLDLPEVSLVAILDADKEGFLRSKTALIQIMGRAARHRQGKVILYADNLTGSIKEAVAEIKRRRKIQRAYNRTHHLVPQTIVKPIRKQLVEKPSLSQEKKKASSLFPNTDSLLPQEKKKLLASWRREMKKAARDLDFEKAIFWRDQVRRLEKEIGG